MHYIITLLGFRLTPTVVRFPRLLAPFGNRSWLILCDRPNNIHWNYGSGFQGCSLHLEIDHGYRVTDPTISLEVIALNHMYKLMTCFNISFFLQAMVVDDVNKVLICLHAKVGCSTWKWIMVNNTAKRPVKPTKDLGVIHSLMWNYDLSRINNKKYSDEDIKHKLENYYKIMVVRHPYDR